MKSIKKLRAAGLIILIISLLSGCGTPSGQSEAGGTEKNETAMDKEKAGTCQMSISCTTLLKRLDDLKAGKEKIVPEDGVILEKREVPFYEGETVFDVLLRETKENKIHMEYSFTPGFKSNYIEGIGNLYEFDCGPESGWMFCVNGEYPNYGCSRIEVKQDDVIEWNYTCDLGRDLGSEVFE